MRQHPTTGKACGAVGDIKQCFFQGGLDFHSDGKIEIVEEEAISAPVEGMRQHHHSIACLFNVFQTLFVVNQ